MATLKFLCTPHCFRLFCFLAEWPILTTPATLIVYLLWYRLIQLFWPSHCRLALFCKQWTQCKQCKQCQRYKQFMRRCFLHLSWYFFCHHHMSPSHCQRSLLEKGIEGQREGQLCITARSIAAIQIQWWNLNSTKFSARIVGWHQNFVLNLFDSVSNFAQRSESWSW